jgi:hypothetical protein
LALLTLPIIVSWLMPLVSVPALEIAVRRTFIGAVAHGVLLLSLFVLGGGFWAKVHALFVRDARVAPDTAVASGVAGNPEPVQLGGRFYLGIAVFNSDGCSFRSLLHQDGALVRSQAFQERYLSPTNSGWSSQ